MGLPIQLAQLRQQQLHGNTVTDDVMLHQQQVVALIGQLDGQHPQQVVTGQIERLIQHLMLHFFCSGFRGIFLRQILPLNLDSGVIKDALTAMCESGELPAPVAGGGDGAVDVVVLRAGDGVDRVTAFHLGEDLFELSGLAFEDLSFVDEAEGAVILGPGGRLAIVSGVSSVELDDAGLFV